MTEATTMLFSDLVREIDTSEEERPAYEFSGGRTFDQPPDPYRSGV